MCGVTKRSISVLIVLAAAAHFAAAQADLGSLSGSITDPSGGAVAGAKVTVTSQATGAQRTAPSGSSGNYLFSSLTIGTYNVTVDQAGFQRATGSVIVDPGKNSRLDIQLTVGTTSTTIEVSAATVGLSQDTANIGMVFDNQVIVSTPLFMRNWDDLTRLVPGVQQNRYTEQGGATASGRTGDFEVNGSLSFAARIPSNSEWMCTRPCATSFRMKRTCTATCSSPARLLAGEAPIRSV
jgi:hypothetical protein